uniref:Uncharacterized protein n=1 Tax=Arundo donax TaxID=35708 RepID=A0A0A9UBF5_ARUDO
MIAVYVRSLGGYGCCFKNKVVGQLNHSDNPLIVCLARKVTLPNDFN